MRWGNFSRYSSAERAVVRGQLGSDGIDTPKQLIHCKGHPCRLRLLERKRRKCRVPASCNDTSHSFSQVGVSQVARTRLVKTIPCIVDVQPGDPVQIQPNSNKNYKV